MVKLATISPDDINYLKERGCILETFDNGADRMGWRYLYHPKISNSLFMHYDRDNKFFELDVDDIQDINDKNTMKELIKKSFF